MKASEQADRNVRAFLIFRIFFNTRFYYPVLAVLFLDLGLSLEQYSLLNVAWAVSIFGLEVPSGALADMWGRKKLVVIAGFLMVIEMLVFAFTPSDNVQLLFYLFLLNRVLSGAAEAAASGADEALVYDSLQRADRAGEWPRVLARLGRLQSVSFFVAMMVGAAVYDPRTVNLVGQWFGFGWDFTAPQLVRMPLYLTLAMSLVACASALTMYEAPMDPNRRVKLATAARDIVRAAKWIAASPVVLFVILATLCNDAFIRLFMTMTSQYFRVLGLPAALFGLLGSATALLGFVSPWIAGRLIKLGSARAAFGVLSVATVAGLFALPFATSLWSLVYVFWLSLGMGVVGFLASYYLNELAEPAQRATILSFRGLSTNLAYGTLGVMFAAVLKSIAKARAAAPENEVFLGALSYLPWVFLGVIGVAYLLRTVFRRRSVPPTS
ncbi:MAG TPA: MFS transporter [Bdellovibrionota bacterium]|nr:MFS transporter [Bdellovibrionota bacterium]